MELPHERSVHCWAGLSHWSSLMLKFLGGTVGIIFLIGLVVVVGLFMLIF